MTTMKMLRISVLTAMLAGGVLHGHAKAANLQITTLTNPQAVDFGSGNFSLGWEFDVGGSGIKVTHLGKYGWRDLNPPDMDGTPLTLKDGFVPNVNIWSVPDQVKVATTTIPLLTPLASDGGPHGYVAWVDIPDVILAPGTYRIAVDTGGGEVNELYLRKASAEISLSTTIGSPVTVGAGVYVEPSLDAYPNTVIGSPGENFFGPNMIFESPQAAVPEPSTFLLAALGLAGLGIFTLRKVARS